MNGKTGKMNERDEQWSLESLPQTLLGNEWKIKRRWKMKKREWKPNENQMKKWKKTSEKWFINRKKLMKSEWKNEINKKWESE